MTTVPQVVNAVQAAWQAAVTAAGLPAPVLVGGLSDISGDELCSVALGDFERGGVSAQPVEDDMAAGYLVLLTVRCAVTVFDGSSSWESAADRVGDYYDACVVGLRADVSLGRIAVWSGVTAEQEWHFDPHAGGGGSAGVEFAVQVQVQQ